MIVKINISSSRFFPPITIFVKKLKNFLMQSFYNKHISKNPYLEIDNNQVILEFTQFIQNNTKMKNPFLQLNLH